MTRPRGSRPDRIGKPQVEPCSAGKASGEEAIGKPTGDVKVHAEGEAAKRSSKSDGRPGSTRTP